MIFSEVPAGVARQLHAGGPHRARWAALVAGTVVALTAGGFGPGTAAALSLVTATIDVGDSPVAVAVDPSLHRVYVANRDDGTISVIDESGDARTGEVIATIVIGGYLEAIAVDPSTHDVYVTEAFSGTMSVIDESGDARTGDVVATIAVGAAPDAVAVDPSTHAVYVADLGDGTVSVVDESGDTRTGTVTASIPVGNGPAGLAVDPSTHDVYVTNSDDDTVSVVDESGGARTGTVIATVPVGDDPLGVAVDPSTHLVYVADFGDDTGSVIDGSDAADRNTVIATFADSGGAEGVAVDSATHDVYVTSSFGGSLLILDESRGATHAAETSVDVDTDSHAVAVDSFTHNVYITGFEADPGGPRPGTVSVITTVAARADLSLSVTGPPRAADRSRFTMRATVTNDGPADAPGTTTNLLIPDGLAVISAPGATVEAGTLVWAGTDLPSGRRVSYSATFGVAGGVHRTIAIGGVVESVVSDPAPSNNAAIATMRLG